jgi:hypothetical protein
VLVRNQVVDRVDRDLEGTSDPLAVVSGMYEVLADMRTDLVEMAEDAPETVAGLLGEHARLLAAAHAYVFGRESGAGLPGRGPGGE